jgi:hypothetical protein
MTSVAILLNSKEIPNSKLNLTTEFLRGMMKPQVEGETMGQASTTEVFNAPIEKAFEVLTDY